MLTCLQVHEAHEYTPDEIRKNLCELKKATRACRYLIWLACCERKPVCVVAYRPYLSAVDCIQSCTLSAVEACTPNHYRNQPCSVIASAWLFTMWYIVVNVSQAWSFDWNQHESQGQYQVLVILPSRMYVPVVHRPIQHLPALQPLKSFMYAL